MSTKSVAYRVLMGRVDVLERLVAEALAEGWQLQGGATFAANSVRPLSEWSRSQSPRAEVFDLR